jgi:hypothetical protein
MAWNTGTEFFVKLMSKNSNFGQVTVQNTYNKVDDEKVVENGKTTVLVLLFKILTGQSKALFLLFGPIFHFYLFPKPYKYLR